MQTVTLQFQDNTPEWVIQILQEILNNSIPDLSKTLDQRIDSLTRLQRQPVTGARDFLLEDDGIREAVDNGYDIRLDESEWIRKMEQFAWAYFTRTDLRRLLSQHPNREEVTNSCLHFLGDEAQEWWSARNAEKGAAQNDPPAADVDVREYIVSGNELFQVKSITQIRDGGTVEIDTGNYKYYIHKNLKTIHSGYPASDGNEVHSRPLKAYILEAIGKYIVKNEEALAFVRGVLGNLRNQL